MAKELPYFQFEPAEYLTKDISFCSLSAQGLFINLCSYYWQRECKLTKDQFLKRLNNPKELQELIDENIITIEGNCIKISFLDDQYKKITEKSITNSINGSKGGRPKKINPIKTEPKPNQNQTETEPKGIREDKIKEDESKVTGVDDVKDKSFEERKEAFIKWFNESKLKYTGVMGRSRTIPKKDINNLKQLFKHYEFSDFKKAIPNLYSNQWAKDNNMLTISHFIRIENFNKYLEQEPKKERKAYDFI